MNVPVVYFKDQKEFKMAGITLMTRQNVAIYENKERKKKLVQVVLSIDRGGHKSSLEISLNK